MVIHDDKGKSISEFPEIEGKRVLPTAAQNLLVSEKHDYIEVFYPTDRKEIYVFKNGGASGTQVAKVVLTYSTTSKDRLTSVTKT